LEAFSLQKQRKNPHLEVDLVSKRDHNPDSQNVWYQRKERIMAFGPIMRFKVGELQIELAPFAREDMRYFIDPATGGGMQQAGVTEFVGMKYAPVLPQEEKWYDKVCEDMSSLLWGIWLIEGDTRTLIGNSSLNGIGKEGHSGFIRQAVSGSLIFRKDFWGRGVASAAHKARTWYAFEHLGLHRIQSAVIQANGGSRKALERSGYTFVYTERNEQFSSGMLHHMDCLECLNPRALFWNQWWHGDRPSRAALAARKLTLETLEWAQQNVELP
jgi:RimJ/RimL family protein N-acetyltransferase